MDLSKIVCPVLNVAGAKDYTCPPSQAEPTIDLVGSDDKEFLVTDDSRSRVGQPSVLGGGRDRAKSGEAGPEEVTTW